jgi:hypothetical protein
MQQSRTSRKPHRRTRLGLGLSGALIALALAAGHAGGPASAEPTHGVLRIAWQEDLPPYPNGPALDIRWASDHSVYLAWVKEGVTETALDGKFTRLRTLIADPVRWMLGFEMLAVSPQYTVASYRARTMVFRPTRSRAGGLVAISRVFMNDGIVEDLDLSGDRFLLLGNPAWSESLESPAPPIAWIGPLGEHPGKDLRPLPLYDAGGPRSPGLVNCSELRLGGARFLPDGSLFVVPGFQPGAHQLTAGGRLLRTWDTPELGLDAVDCAHLGEEQHRLFGRSPKARFEFINQHRVLDAILPLAAGPGLLVRFVKDGAVHWELKILESGARVLTYQVPLVGELPYDRLRGDVRGDRIVFLRGAHGFDKWGPPFRANHVAVAELPFSFAAPEKGGAK